MKRLPHLLWNLCLLIVPIYAMGHFLALRGLSIHSIHDLNGTGRFVGVAALCLLISLLLFRKVRLQRERDTVVYFLKQGRKTVYVGIAYQRRAEKRIAEHRQSGKRFNGVTWSNPMSREKALRREKSLIQRIRPTYNISHKE